MECLTVSVQFVCVRLIKSGQTVKQIQTDFLMIKDCTIQYSESGHLKDIFTSMQGNPLCNLMSRVATISNYYGNFTFLVAGFHS